MTGTERSAGQVRVRQGAAAAATVTVVGGMLVMGGQPVSAATITVDSAADDGSGGLTFREAVEQANLSAGADEIVFDASLLGSTITLDYATVRINDDLKIVGLGEAQLTLTTTGGDILYVYNAATLELSDITLTGAGNNGLRTRNSGDVTVARTTISDSLRSGIWLYSGGADIAVLDSHLDGNTDDGLTIYSAANVTVTDTTLSGSGGDGLATYYYNGVSGSVTLTRVDASNNGDVGVSLSYVDGDLSIVDSNLSGNVREGVRASYVGAVSVSGTSIEDNGSAGARLYRSGEVTLSDVTVSDNRDHGVSAAYVATNMMVSDVTMTGNSGSGLNLRRVDGDVSVSGSAFVSNADYGSGAAVSNIGGAVSVSGSTFSSNYAYGLVVNAVAGAMTVTDVTAESNGYSGLQLEEGGAVSVTDSTVSSNDRPGLIGRNLGDVTIVGVTSADNNGGGIYLYNSGSVEISSSTASGNVGAGVRLYNLDDLTMSDTTIAESGAQGIRLTNSVGPVSISNSTLVGNDSATNYSVVRINDSTSLTITHSTVTGNGAADQVAAVIAAETAAVTVDHTVLTDNNDAPVFFTSDTGTLVATNSLTPVGSDLGASNVESDAPLLGALADNGGATPTMLPLEGSPVIDAGDPAIASPPATDQRGDARVVDIIDIGAVETANGTLSVVDATVDEDAGAVEVTVERVGAADTAASADIVLTGDTATPSDDFGTPTPSSVSWDAGEVGAQTVSIPIVDDDAIEDDETFTVTLTGATIPVTDDVATVTITDDDEEEEPPVGPSAAATSLSPARFVDTRNSGSTLDDQFEAEGKRAADSEYTVQIAGRGDVPADAKAVIINVAAVAADDVGFVTVHPCSTPRPLASSLNFTPGVNLSNEIVAPLNDVGELCIYTSASAHLLVDVVGFVGADSPTVPVTPARYLDTRPAGETFDAADQGNGKTTAEGSVTLQVADRGDVPADAAAVIVNVTAVGPTETGFVTVHPCADTPPNASSLNYVAGVNRANELVASVDDDGQICLFTSSSVHLLVDVVGYVPGGSTLNPIAPARFLDTRGAGVTVDGAAQQGGKRAADTEVELQVTGRPGVPEGATAVVVNVTVAAPEANGFVTVHPCVDPLPNTSSLNYVAGVNGANELIALLDADGKICLYTSESAHLIVDVVAYLD